MLWAMFFYLFPAVFLTGSATGEISNNTAEVWTRDAKESEGLTLDSGLATPTGAVSRYRSVRTFKNKRSASAIVFEPSPAWQNWTPIRDIPQKR